MQFRPMQQLPGRSEQRLRTRMSGKPADGGRRLRAVSAHSVSAGAFRNNSPIFRLPLDSRLGRHGGLAGPRAPSLARTSLMAELHAPGDAGPLRCPTGGESDRPAKGWRTPHRHGASPCRQSERMAVRRWAGDIPGSCGFIAPGDHGRPSRSSQRNGVALPMRLPSRGCGRESVLEMSSRQVLRDTLRQIRRFSRSSRACSGWLGPPAVTAGQAPCHDRLPCPSSARPRQGSAGLYSRNLSLDPAADRMAEWGAPVTASCHGNAGRFRLGHQQLWAPASHSRPDAESRPDCRAAGKSSHGNSSSRDRRIMVKIRSRFVGGFA